MIVVEVSERRRNTVYRVMKLERRRRSEVGFPCLQKGDSAGRSEVTGHNSTSSLSSSSSPGGSPFFVLLLPPERLFFKDNNYVFSPSQQHRYGAATTAHNNDETHLVPVYRPAPTTSSFPSTPTSPFLRALLRQYRTPHLECTTRRRSRKPILTGAAEALDIGWTGSTRPSRVVFPN